jgi:hypothetical protein
MAISMISAIVDFGAISFLGFQAQLGIGMCDSLAHVASD